MQFTVIKNNLYIPVQHLGKWVKEMRYDTFKEAWSRFW